jgi:hypothetical protein
MLDLVGVRGLQVQIETAAAGVKMSRAIASARTPRSRRLACALPEQSRRRPKVVAKLTTPHPPRPLNCRRLEHRRVTRTCRVERLPQPNRPYPQLVLPRPAAIGTAMTTARKVAQRSWTKCGSRVWKVCSWARIRTTATAKTAARKQRRHHTKQQERTLVPPSTQRKGRVVLSVRLEPRI